MADEVIRMENVSKIYETGGSVARALRGVSFSVSQGEFVSIMGPSGSGKSTCMNMIGCLDRPTSGTVKINGRETALMDENELAALRNRTIGFVFQQYYLLAGMSAIENVALPLRYKGVPRAQRSRIAEEALALVGMSDRLRHKPNELSGGQKQRVAIARAVVTEPRVILADEPTGALDSETGAQVIALFRAINARGATVVIVTHDEGIGASADRRIKIFDGMIQSDEND